MNLSVILIEAKDLLGTIERAAQEDPSLRSEVVNQSTRIVTSAEGAKEY